jgi:hypothetical protein
VDGAAVSRDMPNNGGRSREKLPTTFASPSRQSAPYLKDAGWRETATLVLVAADEIEQLNGRRGVGQTQRTVEGVPRC